jgi:hypothetical protein
MFNGYKYKQLRKYKKLKKIVQESMMILKLIFGTNTRVPALATAMTGAAIY